MRRITVALVLTFIFTAGVLAGFMDRDARASTRPTCWLTACTKGILWSCCRDEYGITTCVKFRCLPDDFAGINLPTGY